MCTAVTYRTKDFYFGRTLDHDVRYGEQVVVTPRGFPFDFIGGDQAVGHYAMIGMAHVSDGYPLYYDATNEKGLCIAGLNFVGNAAYGRTEEGKRNLAQFELIPYLLGTCASVREAERRLKEVNLTARAFRKGMPAAQLHWLIADRDRAITAEFAEGGWKLYENSVGVLTNNPVFDRQLAFLENFGGLSPKNTCRESVRGEFSLGTGAIGLPGDWTSQSRFVRAAFVRKYSESGAGEEESVNQFFHILGTVSLPRGCSLTDGGGRETTQYISCCNADKGIYYFTTYENHCIRAVGLYGEDLDGNRLYGYPAHCGETVLRLNPPDRY